MKKYNIIAKFAWQDEPVQTNTEPCSICDAQEALEFLMESRTIIGCEWVRIERAEG